MQQLFQLLIAAPLMSFCLFGCGTPIQSESLVQPRVVTEQYHTLRLEIADDAEERRDGLMFRTSLDEDAGMLFVFEQESPRSFWMKNTLIPLDVLYINSSFEIVDIKNMPPCGDLDPCPSYPSAAPAQYALEINGGRATELNIRIGDTLRFFDTSLSSS